jgi:PhnB protein
MAKSKGPIPEGFHTVTPYLVMPGIAGLMEFLKQAFDAQELERMARQDGSIAHSAMKIGDSMVEMGEAPGEGRAMPAALHLYVKNSDETYQRALQAGATSLYEPRHMDYGDHEGGVTDPRGNQWYIATHKGGQHFAPEGLRSVTSGFSVKGAAEFLAFLAKAFGAQIIFRKEAPNGTVGYAKVRIGDSIIECSEAHGEWGPRPATLHLYVPDVDGIYKDAIAAGGKSLSEPRDQFYGERSGGVVDAWGNHWYIATHTEDLTTDELMSRGASQGESAH